MAKQTYTSGQVLSAAQMTTLQANDYNQTVSAKVASYTLVAADAGTRITMSNASATTITVNTGLFAAGDTLYITNIGAGACTITAGTATVSTASSLVLAQYDSGVLYFTSAGVAIWQKYDGAAAAGGAANWSLLNSGGTALAGSSTVTVSGISGKDKIMILFDSAEQGAVSQYLQIRINGDTGGNYTSFGGTITNRPTYNTSIIEQLTSVSADVINMCQYPRLVTDGLASGFCLISGANSSGLKMFNFSAASNNGGADTQTSYTGGGYWSNTATVTSVSIKLSSAVNFGSGTVYVYTSA